MQVQGRQPTHGLVPGADPSLHTTLTLESCTVVGVQEPQLSASWQGSEAPGLEPGSQPPCPVCCGPIADEQSVGIPGVHWASRPAHP